MVLLLPARKLIDDTIITTQENAKANLRLYTEERTNKKQKRKHALEVNMMVCAGIMFLMFLGYTSLGAKITTVGHEINELKQQIAEVENTNDRLMLEVEELSSPEALAAFAEKEMGMVQTTEANVIYQEFSDSVKSDLQIAQSDSLNTVVAAQGSASVEVVDDSASHPILDTLHSLIQNFTKEKEDKIGVAQQE